MYNPLLALAFLVSVSAPAAPAATPEQRQALDAARRVVATLQLAGQEYRLAFRGGCALRGGLHARGGQPERDVELDSEL